MLHFLGVFWFFLTTVLFFKATVLGLVFLNVLLLISAWRTRTLPSLPPVALLFWGIASGFLLIHSLVFSVDPSWSLPYCMRFISLLLQVACLQLWTSKPEFVWSSLKISPNSSKVFPLFVLLTVCFIALQVQFFCDGLLTRALNTLLGMSLPLPRTFKPYLAILTVNFFLFMGLSACHSSWIFRVLPSFFLGMSLLTVAVLMNAYTNCLALILGFCVFFATCWVPRFTIAVSGLTLFSSLLVFPFVIHYLWDVPALRAFTTTLPTFAQRVLHWNELSPLITEKFFTGWGLGYSYVLSQGKDLILPLTYPHNMALELWIDLGLGGVLLTSIFLGILFWNLHKNSHKIVSATGMALLVSTFTMAQTGYSNLHLWWVAALSICSFFIQVCLPCHEVAFSTEKTSA